MTPPGIHGGRVSAASEILVQNDIGGGMAEKTGNGSV